MRLTLTLLDICFIELLEKPNIDVSSTDVALDRCHLVVDPTLFSDLTDRLLKEAPPLAPCLDSLPRRMDTLNCLTDGDKLKTALQLAQTIKDAILRDTSYQCSIGVASNRMLAKIACSLNKPNKITVVPSESAQHLLNYTPIKKVPNLGGKLGNDVSSRFDLKFFGALSEIPHDALVEEYGEKTGSWLYDLCRGVDRQPVSVRTLVQSIACSKNFYGKSALTQTSDVQKWLVSLAGELVERVAVDRGEHGRLPTSLTLHVHCGRRDKGVSQPNVASQPPAFSRALKPLVLASIKGSTEQAKDETTQAVVAEKIAKLAFTAIQSVLHGSDDKTCPPIVNLGLTAGKFRSDSALNCGNLQELLLTQANKRHTQATREEGDSDTREENEIVPTTKRASFFRQFIQVPTSCADKKSMNSVHAVPSLVRAQPTSSPPIVDSNSNLTKSFFRRFINSSEAASIPGTEEDGRPLTDAAPCANKSECLPEGDRYSIRRFVMEDRESSRTQSQTQPIEIHRKDREKVVHEDATHTSGDTDSTHSYVDLENTIICEECGARVLIHLMSEHTDFHVAHRIQQEWNREEQVSTARTARPSERTPLPSRGIRGGRGTKRRPSAKQPVNVTLDRFFSKS
uniref:DNA polymerase eta n=4 Tax=Schistocephalus solidus TaxID=70667 RepID=A0A0X3PIG8_SCHSO